MTPREGWLGRKKAKGGGLSLLGQNPRNGGSQYVTIGTSSIFVFLGLVYKGGNDQQNKMSVDAKGVW